MKKNKLWFNMLLLMLTLTLSCNFGADPLSGPDFAFYLLEDQSLTWGNFLKIHNKDSLRLKEWITPEMIEYYEYSTHIIDLSRSVLTEQSKWGNGIFVACVGGERCYYGRRYTELEWNGPPPLSWNLYIPSDDLIGLYYPISHQIIKNDYRKDNKIKNALISSKKYRGGIHVEFTNIRSWIENDTAVFEYSFNIQNIDEQGLYVIKPETYFLSKSSGAGIYGITSILLFPKNQLNYTDFKLSPSSIPGIGEGAISEYDLKPEKLLYLKKGEKTERTFRQKNLSPVKVVLPEGEYYAVLNFSSVIGSKVEQRSLTRGRVLNGDLKSNIMDITYSKEHGIVINNRNVVFDE